MPSNEVEDRICNSFEQDNSSQGHLQSQANLNVQQLDSTVGPGSESLRVSFDQNHAHVILRPQFSKSYSRYQQLNSNDLIFGHKNLQTSISSSPNSELCHNLVRDSHLGLTMFSWNSSTSCSNNYKNFRGSSNFSSWVRGAPPSVQRLPNRLPNAQEQGQAVQ
ncbi:hypothetical protein AAG906_014302 [Vitis piasezkii]